VYTESDPVSISDSDSAHAGRGAARGTVREHSCMAGRGGKKGEVGRAGES
jgi:hypothetical protein